MTQDRGGTVLKKAVKVDPIKIEVAKELGLWEKVQKEGWSGLTAQETGRIGGFIGKRKKAMKKDK
ncbi:small, acid-soluble spore protein, alpha/beta type [Xylanivirga thermophila]|uniref:small, acid-soluble spore protein, alpha/beta type n=1 Tax=Xylanivirga thermophila TaxID=2496273 RepID=UPI0037434C3B